jgi:hypothetical protein
MTVMCRQAVDEENKDMIIKKFLSTISVGVLRVRIRAFGPQQTIAVELVGAGGKSQRIFAKVHAANMHGKVDINP